MTDLEAATKWSKDYDEVVTLYKKNQMKGRSMIHVVAKLGRHDLIDAATDMDLKTGALLNLKTGSQGWTALHFAAQKGEDKFIKALLRKEYVDINVKTTILGRTALHIAALNGHTSTVNLLLDHKIKIETKDEYSGTALHAAAYVGHLDVLKTLIKKNAKIEAKTNNGETPLHYAASNGKASVVRYLLAYKADPSAKVTAGSNKGMTPRELAIQKKHKDVVDMLK